jgi:hypothetical protein
MSKPFDLVGNIVAFESGELSGDGVLALFSHLVKTGLVWTLQGSYGRSAESLIENGYLDNKGTILKEFDNE